MAFFEYLRQQWSALTSSPATQSPGEDHFLKLPADVLRYIAAYLGPLELVSMTMVCRRWKKVVSSEDLWVGLFYVNHRNTMREYAAIKSWRKVYVNWLRKAVREMRSNRKGWPRDIYVDSDKLGAIYVKLVLFGADGVGKTCLRERLATGHIKSVHYTPTIGYEFANIFRACRHEHFRINFWDTAGQDRFQSIVAHGYRGATCAAFVYAAKDGITERDLQRLDAFFANPNADPNLPVVVIRTKCDLLAATDSPPPADNEPILKGVQRLAFCDFSALTGYGTEEVISAVLATSHFDINPKIIPTTTDISYRLSKKPWFNPKLLTA